MAVYSIIPNQFTADDVRDTLNASGGNVGNNWMDYFSLLAKINVWSKYKPVIHPSPFSPANNDAYWYRSSKAGYLSGRQPCGISVNLLSKDRGEITYSNINIKRIWRDSYNNPTGGASAPCRMTDFVGYNASARNPFDCSFPVDNTIYVGDDITGDSLKCFFTGLFSGNPLNESVITPLDIECAFQNTLPSNSKGIVGILCYVGIRFYLKTINVNDSNPIALVNLNVSETKEADFYNRIINNTGEFFPVFCTKEIPLWTNIDNYTNQGLEIIMFPGEVSNYKRNITMKRYETPIVVDYIIRCYRYGSNFSSPFNPMESSVVYNGIDSKLDFEMEIICISDAVSGGNTTPRIGHNFTSVANRKISVAGDYAETSGGSWTTVNYNGKTYKAYRWNKYTIKSMYLNEYGNAVHNTGTIPVTWTNTKYKVEGSFYMYLQ